MTTLAIIAFALAVAIFALRVYLKSHPPDVSAAGIRSLQRGLRLGTVSSITLLLLYIIYYFRPVAFGRNLPFVACAFAGNILNLAAVVDCLRELSGESLFAACLLLLNQLLWILYALVVTLVDF